MLHKPRLLRARRKVVAVEAVAVSVVAKRRVQTKSQVMKEQKPPRRRDVAVVLRKRIRNSRLLAILREGLRTHGRRVWSPFVMSEYHTHGMYFTPKSVLCTW